MQAQRCTDTFTGHAGTGHAGKSPDGAIHARRALPFRPALVAWFLVRTRSPDDAEDLTQDVFMRLLGCAAPAEIRTLRGYVFQIANSVFIDWLRRSRTRAAGAHDPLSDVLADPEAVGCEHSLLAREQLDCVRAGLLELPEQTRSILVLRRLEGWKNARIAEDLGVSLSTVEKHLHQGTRHLRGRLEEAL